MSRSIFGWDLPPGCTHQMIEDQVADSPCAVCGNMNDCICPECTQCGSQGDPTCYENHGLVRTKEQIASLKKNEEAWEAEAKAEAEYWEQYAKDYTKDEEN